MSPSEGFIDFAYSGRIETFRGHQKEPVLLFVIQVEGANVGEHLLLHQRHDVVHCFPEIVGLAYDLGNAVKEADLVFDRTHLAMVLSRVLWERFPVKM